MVILDATIIEENKQKFISILRTITREGAMIDELIAKLESSDFFRTPASTKYHNSCEGGLCDHSLNVYYNLCSLVKNKHLESRISDESIAIVALLHDFSKMNCYEKSARNVKVYSPTGSKHDELGNFDWVAELSYTTVSDNKKFIYGNHEETSEFMARNYIPLTYEESAAILHHHGGMGFDSCQSNIASKVMTKYPLATLLHLADCLATFIDEGEYLE